jgi:putative DNA primase/helicase
MMNQEITPEQIKEEARKHADKADFKTTCLSHDMVLSELLNKMTKVDFRQEVDSDKKLRRKHFVVTVVEKVLAIANQQNLGLCKRHDFIYLYNGSFWKQIEKDELKRFLGKAALKMGVDRFDSNYHHFRDDLVSQFMSLAYLSTSEYPADVVLVNLKNGTVEVQPDKESMITLRQPKQEDFLTYQLPFAYKPMAEAPKFNEYLDRVLPDKKLQHILAEYIGYVFVRSSYLKLEKTMLLYGTGGNGKSVFFDIVNALLGNHNITNFNLRSLTDEKGYERAKIGDALLNYSSEIDGKVDAALFKQMVSGEPVQARLPYKDPITLTNYAKLIFNCNELPTEVENTDAFFRRFLIIPFDQTIPKEEQDKELSKKIIRSELSGVFNWVLRGLERILKQKGFTTSEKVEEQLRQYRKDSDSVLSFLDEYDYEKDVSHYVPLKELYAKYKRYCEENGNYHCNNKNFSKRLRSAKFKVVRKANGNVVYLIQNK